MGGGGSGVQRVGVGQPVLLRAQRGFLARLRVELLDLGEARPQLLGLGGAGAGLRRQRGELVEYLAVAAVGALVVGQDLGQHRAGVLVERLALTPGLEQLLLVGLPVHGNQVIGEVGEQGHRDRAAARESPGPPLARYGPGQHQGAVLVKVAARLFDLLRGLAARVGAEPPLDRGALRARPYPSRVAAPAEQQAEPGDDHGLTRAGLAGQGGKAGRKLEQRVIDDPEPGDAHFLKHDRQPSPSRPNPADPPSGKADFTAAAAQATDGPARCRSFTAAGTRSAGAPPIRSSVCLKCRPRGAIKQIFQPETGSAPTRPRTAVPGR